MAPEPYTTRAQARSAAASRMARVEARTTHEAHQAHQARVVVVTDDQRHEGGHVLGVFSNVAAAEIFAGYEQARIGIPGTIEVVVTEWVVDDPDLSYD